MKEMPENIENEGVASRSGRGGRRFESSHSDQLFFKSEEQKAQLSAQVDADGRIFAPHAITGELVELLPDRGLAETEFLNRMRLGLPDPKPPRSQARIYFLQCEQFVKIGYASNVDARVVDHADGCPFPQKLRATMPGSRSEERKLHKRFSHLRHRGEWFRLDDELEAFISKRENAG